MKRRTKIISIIVMLTLAIVPVSVMELRERYIASHHVMYAMNYRWTIPKISLEQRVEAIKSAQLPTSAKSKPMITNHAEKHLACQEPTELLQGNGFVRRCEWE